MVEELTIGAAISILIGIMITAIQFLVPSVEETILTLTKDIVMESSAALPAWFNFILIAMLNIALTAIPVGGLMALLKKF